MAATTARLERPQTRCEAVAGSIRHGVGFVAKRLDRLRHPLWSTGFYLRSTTNGTKRSASRTRCATPCASSRLAYGPA